MEEDDQLSVGTAEILRREPFAAITASSSASAIARVDAKNAAGGGFEDTAGSSSIKPQPPPPPFPQQPLMPAQPSTPTSLLALEAELIARHSAASAEALACTTAAAAAAADDVGVRFMVDTEWLRQWNGYVHGQQGCLPPGPLSNLALYDARTLRLRQGLVQEIDYKALTPVAFYILAILYGTASDESVSTSGSGDNAAMPPEICRYVLHCHVVTDYGRRSEFHRTDDAIDLHSK